MFFASLVDLLNLNMIIQDNLKDLNDSNKPAEPKKDQDKEVKPVGTAQTSLERIEKEASKSIQQKMKLVGEV